MRPIRQNTPGRRWFLTSRTLESRFFLKPDPEAVQIVGFFLAQALGMFPGIKLFAVSVLSNHWHLVVEDRAAQLSAFCEYFIGNVARDINVLRGRSGTVFPRRFSAEEILDDEAFAERIRYTLLNPAAARLVNAYEEWPGLVAWAGFNASCELHRFNRREFKRSMRKAEPGCEPKREDFMSSKVLELAPLPEGIDAEKIEQDVRAEERRLRLERPRVLGRKAILAQRFDAQPAQTERSHRPLVHASSTKLWFAYLDRVRAFRALYRWASERFRAGQLDVKFPDWTFRPRSRVRPEFVAT